MSSPCHPSSSLATRGTCPTWRTAGTARLCLWLSLGEIWYAAARFSHPIRCPPTDSSFQANLIAKVRGICDSYAEGTIPESAIVDRYV